MARTDTTEGTGCPTCGRDDFSSDRAMKIHHQSAHGESLISTTECEHCGSEFRPNSSVDTARFCSRECKDEWQSEGLTGEDNPKWKGGEIEKTCENCGSVFTVRQYRRETAKFCSKDCRQDAFVSERVPRVEKSCVECGCVYQVPEYQESRSRFCSRRCKDNWLEGLTGADNPQWGSINLECDQCGGAYNRTPSHLERFGSRFCSRTCKAEWQSENLVGENAPSWRGGDVECECELCGTVYETNPADAKHSRFCSQDCLWDWLSANQRGPRHHQWLGGSGFDYGKGWTSQKRKHVRIRDQARCQHCGRTEADHLDEFGTKHVVHHITPARQVDDPEARNAMENLITLCRGACHRTWEQMAPLRPDAQA